MKTFRFFLGLVWIIAMLLPATAFAQSSSPQAVVIDASGPVTPVMAGYIERGIALAEERQARLVVLTLDTPGGGIELMTQIVQTIRASQVPVVVYVSPNGAIAGSAGTLITLAGHAAAMAPETSIGAASPVGMQGEDIGTTMEAKTKEILKAQARSLSEARPEAARLVIDDMIDSARAVSASEALNVGIVDYIARDIPDLLAQMNDRQLTMADGSVVTLQTTGISLLPAEQTLVEQALGLLTNPNIVFLLLTLGVQAVLIELSSPGGWVAGFVGAVALLLAIYGLGILPVNWFGMLFIVLAFVLFILDIKAPTHGALTIAGTGALVAGALVLFNSTRPSGFQPVSVPLVIGVAIFVAASFTAIIGFALRAMRIPVQSDHTRLVGSVGTAQTDINPRGTVQAGGEQYTAELAEGETAISRGSMVEIVAMEGIRVRVRRLD